MELFKGARPVVNSPEVIEKPKEVRQRAPVSRPYPKTMSPVALGASLTASEHHIYNLLTAGLSIEEIAKKLAISEKTVRFHSTKLYRKMGVRGVKQLMALEIKYYRKLKETA